MKILVIGNCQARPIARYLSQSVNSISEVDTIIVHLSDSASESDDIAKIKAADILLTQPVGDNYKAAHLATSRLRYLTDREIVRWPNIFYSGQCPELFTLSTTEGGAIKGPLDTYHSASVFKLWSQGVSVNDTVSQLHQDIPFKTEVLEEIIEESMEMLINRETDIDITISDFIKEHEKDQRLFYTYNHPSAYLLLELCRRLCDYCTLKINNRLIPEFGAEPLSRLIGPTTEPMKSFLRSRYPTSDSSKGLAFKIENKCLSYEKPTIYCFKELVASSFKAFDLQVKRDDVPRCTPSYLSRLLA